MADEVSVTKIDFTVPADKMRQAYTALLAVDGDTPEDYDYADLAECINAQTDLIADTAGGATVLRECPWDIDTGGEDGVITALDAIAPFATEGSLVEFTMRHEGSWRYVVKGGDLVRQDSKVVFE